MSGWQIRHLAVKCHYVRECGALCLHHAKRIAHGRFYLEPPSGFEPETPCLQGVKGRCSTGLSYDGLVGGHSGN
jgi:hypothetical protein